MTTPMIQGLDAKDRVRMGKAILRPNHRLAETGLFADEALARLIDEHPRSELTICAMRQNPPPDQTWIAGEANDFRGRNWCKPPAAAPSGSARPAL